MNDNMVIFIEREICDDIDNDVVMQRFPKHENALRDIVICCM